MMMHNAHHIVGESRPAVKYNHNITPFIYTVKSRSKSDFEDRPRMV